jgi:tripartite-type tricarboxylate transporter receptor subunit TctC
MKKKLLLTFLMFGLITLLLMMVGSQEGAAAEKLWPRNPPVVTVGFGAGGGTDTAVRPLSLKWRNFWAKRLTLSNMPGASSAVAAEYVLDSDADGYNLFATGSGPLSGFRVMGTSETTWRDWISWHPFIGRPRCLSKAIHPFKPLTRRWKP